MISRVLRRQGEAGKVLDGLKTTWAVSKGKAGLGRMVTGWVLPTMAVSAPPKPSPLIPLPPAKRGTGCFLNGWV